MSGSTVVYRPPQPHECWLPKADGYKRDGLVIECDECHLQWIWMECLDVEGRRFLHNDWVESFRPPGYPPS